MAQRLNGKVAIITGTGGGQGRAAALLFAREGAQVVGCDLKTDGNAETLSLADKNSSPPALSTVDVRHPEETKAWIDEAAVRYGKIDIVYNNAAETRFTPFPEMSFEDWRFTLESELNSVFLVSQAAWPHLRANGKGVILNTASAAGLVGHEHVGAAAHCAGKAGVIGLTRQLALEGAPFGIRANSIAPGPIVSPSSEVPLRADPSFRTTFEGWPLLGRVGQPEDVAYVALFLASDEASWITGICLSVDGGWTAKGGFTPKTAELQAQIPSLVKSAV